MRRVLLIEGCDFESHPPGGQLTFAKQLVSVLGPRLALVGLAPAGPVGRWVKRRIGGVEHDFFAIGRVNRSARKPVVPARLSVYLSLHRWRRAISSIGIRDALVLAPEVLLAVHGWGWDSVCFNFAGVNNPLEIARYAWARPIASSFERRFVRHLLDVDVILAAADDRAMDALIARTGGILPRSRLTHFPTFVDTTVFTPDAAAAVPGPVSRPLVVTSGRINRAKGWDLVLHAFERFSREHPGARLVFVGDGEDRPLLQQEIARIGLQGKVDITGFVPGPAVAEHLARADLVVAGSHREGWPTALVEALACGKPIVSTDVSGASKLIQYGRNGFVVPGRDPAQFAAAMTRALALQDARSVSLELAAPYALDRLAARLGELWRPLS